MNWVSAAFATLGVLWTPAVAIWFALLLDDGPIVLRVVGFVVSGATCFGCALSAWATR